MKETEPLWAATPRSLLRDATWALGQLRHLYSQMIGGDVRYPAEAALGLLAPAIAMLEPLIDQGTAGASPPTDSVSESLREARRLLGEAQRFCDGVTAGGAPQIVYARDAARLSERFRTFLGERSDRERSSPPAPPEDVKERK